MYETISVIAEGGVAVVTLRRPEVLNALDIHVYREIAAAMRELHQAGNVRAAIFTGEGDKAFAAGADLKSIQTMDEVQAEEFARVAKEAQELVSTFPGLVIAAVNGLAFGGGCELCLACDLRIASEKARFALPEVGLGLIPGGGGTQRLPQLIGRSQATRLILLGETIGAIEASRLGLVDEVVPPDKLLERATAIALTAASKPPLALSAAKAAILYGLDVSLPFGLDYEIKCFASCFANEEMREGVASFLEKRSRS